MTKPNSPVIPGPLVTVEKRFGRKVGLALVDSNRMFLNGFDSDYPAPVHYRVMPLGHGNFSVMVLADQPVEVRVMMDGKLLAEHRLDPLPQPTNALAPNGSAVKRQVRELVRAPQPFFISFGNDNAPFVFGPDPEGRSSEELVRLQLFPQALEPVEGAKMNLGVDPEHICEAVPDIDPATVGLAPATAPAAPSDEQPTGGDTDGGAEAPAEQAVTMVTSTVDQTNGEVQPGNYRIQAPIPQNWAPSHGLVAIGVRMVQMQTEGEPIMPPDGFDYVLFQLNTWEDHARMRANLMFRVKLPPKAQFKELDDTHGGGHCEEVSHRFCGHANHDPRKFR